MGKPVITAVDVGGVYDCNPPWSNSDTVKITFRIDRSQYPLKCAPGTTAGKPVFQTSPDGNVTYGANCTVTTDIRTSCPFISGTIGCGCTNSNDNSFYVVEYNFIFGPDYHRYWEAEIACLDGNFSKSISFKNNGLNCKPVGRPSSEKPRPIIVGFFNRKKRDDVLASRRNLKGKGIVVGEDLTHTSYKVFRDAKQHSACLNVLSSNGKVFAKLKNGQTLRLDIHTNVQQAFRGVMAGQKMDGN
ncbi:hypothetical protein ACOMHN_063260 [Nucella lapillus]